MELPKEAMPQDLQESSAEAIFEDGIEQFPTVEDVELLRAEIGKVQEQIEDASEVARMKKREVAGLGGGGWDIHVASDLARWLEDPEFRDNFEPSAWQKEALALDAEITPELVEENESFCGDADRQEWWRLANRIQGLEIENKNTRFHHHEKDQKEQLAAELETTREEMNRLEAIVKDRYPAAWERREKNDAFLERVFDTNNKEKDELRQEILQLQEEKIELGKKLEQIEWRRTHGEEPFGSPFDALRRKRGDDPEFAQYIIDELERRYYLEGKENVLEELIIEYYVRRK